MKLPKTPHAWVGEFAEIYSSLRALPVWTATERVTGHLWRTRRELPAHTPAIDQWIDALRTHLEKVYQRQGIPKVEELCTRLRDWLDMLPIPSHQLTAGDLYALIVLWAAQRPQRIIERRINVTAAPRPWDAGLASPEWVSLVDELELGIPRRATLEKISLDSFAELVKAEREKATPERAARIQACERELDILIAHAGLTGSDLVRREYVKHWLYDARLYAGT